MYIPEKGVLDNSNIYFHTPSSIAKSSFFYLKCAGEFFCNGEYKVERETYHSYLIMFIRKGNGFVSDKNRSFQVCANDVIILNCHQPHLYYTNTMWETTWIHFDGNSSSDFFELISSHSGIVLSVEDIPTIPRYLTMIVEGFKRNQSLPEALVSSHIHRILTEMLLFSPDKPDCHIEKMSPVFDAITYIHANFHHSITVGDLAAHVNISSFHFSRMFKKDTGYSPYEYIIKTRIDNAKALLKQTGLNIKEITHKVGFNSESNFVTTFRESVGLTPNEFRNIPV